MFHGGSAQFPIGTGVVYSIKEFAQLRQRPSFNSHLDGLAQFSMGTGVVYTGIIRKPYETGAKGLLSFVLS